MVGIDASLLSLPPDVPPVFFAPLRRFALRGALAVSAIGAAPCAPAVAEPIVVESARGPLELAAPPRTVLVFDLPALDTLDALGVSVAGVPGVHLPPGLSRYARPDTARIGTLFDPDFDTVRVMAPDLVIVGDRAAPQLDALSRIAPTLDLSGGTGSIDAARRAIRTLAALFGREAEAERRLAALDEAMGALREEGRRAGTGLVLLAGGGRLAALGPGSRFGFLHSDFGIAPAIADLEPATHGKAISPDAVNAADPDWIFVIDRDAALGIGDSARREMGMLRRTRARGTGRVVFLDPARWYLTQGGLASLEASVAEIAAALAQAEPR